ncbi:MAG: Txe/YoeB family addiction module toxin [Cyclobacteriaceae bacterium]
MLIHYHPQYKADLRKLLKEDKKLGGKLWELILDIDKYRDNPLSGSGKPEKLRGNYSDFFSRRINGKHRLIYRYEAEEIVLVSCYGHYQDR